MALASVSLVVVCSSGSSLSSDLGTPAPVDFLLRQAFQKPSPLLASDGSRSFTAAPSGARVGKEAREFVCLFLLCHDLHLLSPRKALFGLL
jgi:hypothetical protein